MNSADTRGRGFELFQSLAELSRVAELLLTVRLQALVYRLGADAVEDDAVRLVGHHGLDLVAVGRVQQFDDGVC